MGLEKGQTVTGAYYALFLAPVERRNQEKTFSFEKEKDPFHQDNARVHTCAVSMTKIMKLKFELLQHSLYSPDLALSDLFYS